jgi:uncharacterized iron-regulated membrane protein
MPMTTTVSSKRRADAAVLRRVWRLHFWVGLFAAPVLVVLALSGLVILYTHPLDSWLDRALLVVEQGAATVPLDDQIAVAREQVPDDYALDAVTPQASDHASTRVNFLAPDAPAYPDATIPVGVGNLTVQSP